MTASILAGLAVLAALAALYLHHVFEGECLPADLWREWRLSRTSLKDLDRRWAATTERSDIVVSLTTTPSRIGLIEPALKSLLDQSPAPARIVLNVPYVSRREGIKYVIPDALSGLASVHIQRGEDLGPATKLIPTLSHPDRDAPILVVDDDRIYPRWLVGRYAEAARSWPDRALTLAGWVVPRDLTDRDTTILGNLMMRPPAPVRGHRLRVPREVDVMLGVFSYLVRPRFFDLSEMRDQNAGPPELFLVDDVRTSALCRAPKWVIPAPSLSFIPWASRAALQKTRLGAINAGPGGDEHRHNTIAIRHYADRWRVGGRRGGD